MPEQATILHGDCQELIKTIADNSIDCILTDPPYLYLQKQKLERPFDELELFKQFKRVLKKDGFVILFGRGTSFYRWNTILADLGFNFKEEIIWDKAHCSSPLMAISRVHETVSIYSKGKGIIRKVKVPYLEMKKHDIPAIITDIKRLRSTFNNAKSMKAVCDFLENNFVNYAPATYKHRASENGEHGTIDRAVAVAKSMEEGNNEKSIISGLKDGQKPIRTDRMECSNFTKFHTTTDQRKVGDRCANALQSIEFGLNEKTIVSGLPLPDGLIPVQGYYRKSRRTQRPTIIRQTRDHYTAIHPTQKPARLLERLLNLVIPIGAKATILDPFMGSGSTAVACHTQGLDFVGFEYDKEYFEGAKQRIESLQKPKESTQTNLF